MTPFHSPPPAPAHARTQDKQRHTQTLLKQPPCYLSPLPFLHFTSSLLPHCKHNHSHIFCHLSLVYLCLPSQVLWSSFPFFHFCFSFTPPPPPSSCSPPLIFHFAALPLISQSACGLTEMQGSDGGCQSVSTYLFTNIHTCIHLTHRNQEGNGNSRAILSF